LLNELHWLHVKLHLLRRDAVLNFQCMNETAPDYVPMQFVKRGSIFGCSSRNSQSLNIPFFKSATAQRSFFYLAV
jgi:hypothetical protein